jgi:putative intracellular protease/amidase
MSAKVYGVIPQDGRSGRKALVLSADKFEDLELYVPLFRLIEAGWQVDIAAPARGKITGESAWYYVMANKTIDEVDAQDYQLLIIPGGSAEGAPAAIRKNAKAQDIARSFFRDGKAVAAICHGPWLLADADQCAVERSRHTGKTACRRPSATREGNGSTRTSCATAIS